MPMISLEAASPRAANLAWSPRSHLELSRLKPPISLGVADLAWRSCLEPPTSPRSTSPISLSHGACGNVCNSGWLILVGGDGFVTMVGCGGGFVTVVGYGGVSCGGGGSELGGSGSGWFF